MDSGFIGTIIVGIAFLAMAAIVGRRLNKGKTREQRLHERYEEYDRKIGGVQFVSGEAQTDNEWLASWFSGRAGFTVETVPAEEETEPTEDKPRGKRRNDKGNADAAGAKPAAEPAAGNA